MSESSAEHPGEWGRPGGQRGAKAATPAQSIAMTHHPELKHYLLCPIRSRISLKLHIKVNHFCRAALRVVGVQGKVIKAPLPGGLGGMEFPRLQKEAQVTPRQFFFKYVVQKR